MVILLEGLNCKRLWTSLMA
jgi:hypothetical protein